MAGFWIRERLGRGAGCARRVFRYAARHRGGGRRGGGRGGPGGPGERAAEPDRRHVHDHRGRLGRDDGGGQAGGGRRRGPGAAGQPGAQGRHPARRDRRAYREGRGRRALPAGVSGSQGERGQLRPRTRSRAVTAAAAKTTTRKGALRQARTPATRTPAGRAKPEKPWPSVSAVVATRAASRITAAASSSLAARGGNVIRARSSWPDRRTA